MVMTFHSWGHRMWREVGGLKGVSISRKKMEVRAQGGMGKHKGDGQGAAGEELRLTRTEEVPKEVKGLKRALTELQGVEGTADHLSCMRQANSGRSMGQVSREEMRGVGHLDQGFKGGHENQWEVG